MTDHRKFAEKAEKPGSSRGNLGQKKASREKNADEKLEHMGDTDSSRGEHSKKQKNDKNR